MAQRKTQLEYKPEFLKYGFTEMRERSGNVRPQCVQCLQVLANDSMKENKLKRHLHSVHPKFVEKPPSYWKDKEEQKKRSRIDAPSSTAFSLEKASLASFEVAWIIARCKKPHNIGEELVKPAAVAMLKTIGGADIAKKVESVPLSDNSIKRRIDLISEDILAQLIVALKKAGTFSLQTDESVDIAGNPQLMVFVRYRGEDDIQEEFLFCNALSTTTTGEDIFNMMNNFLKKHDLNWLNCLAVCTDGAPSMMGSRLGFVTRIKAENPDVIIIHCFLHRENLASHRLQPDLHAVLNDAIQIVNFVKARALNSRIFHKMCEEMGSHHQDLLFHSDVRWLSRGKILGRVIELKTEIEIFLREKKHALADCFKDVAWLAKLAYLGDIFMHLNELNSDMQGRNHTMVDIGEKIVSFKKKIALWREKLARGKTAAFPELSAVLEDSSEISLVDIKNIFEDHLKNLQEEMDRYFPENVDLKKHSWIRNVFSVNVSEVGEDIPGFQEELIDLQENQVQKQHFENLQYSKFWTQLKDKPILTREAEKALLPFPTTYLCEQGFSSLVTIKTKARNRLDPQHDLRCALTINIKPNLEDLTHKMKQFHGKRKTRTMMLVAEGMHEECHFEFADGNVDSDENDDIEANEENDNEDSDDGDEEEESSVGEEEDDDEGEESDSDGVMTAPGTNMDQKLRRPEPRVGEGEEEDDSDDDAVPTASSLSAGRDTVEAEEKKVKQEVQRLKEKVREDRKRRHEINKLQQAEKRQRVASLAQIARMPENLLDAVVAEQKTEAKKRAGKGRQGKHTTFDDGDDNDDGGDVDGNEDNDDEGGIVPLQQGVVQVQTLQQQEEKNKTLSQKAAEFKQNRLYGPRLNRMKSSQLQNIKLKQEKSGRSVMSTR